jgi:hypothetical protein
LTHQKRFIQSKPTAAVPSFADTTLRWHLSSQGRSSDRPPAANEPRDSVRRREIPQPDALPDLSTGQNRCGVLALNGMIPNVSSLLRTRLSIRQDN